MKTQKKEYPTGWTFMTNHAHVLLLLARSPARLMRDVAQEVGITERAVQRIVADLRDEGFITLRREGRCNAYEIHGDRHLKHPVECEHTLTELVRILLEKPGTVHPQQTPRGSS